MNRFSARRNYKSASRLRTVEQLESRRLFAADLGDHQPKLNDVSAPYVEMGPLQGSLAFEREGILGSGIASVEGTMPAITLVANPSEVTFVAGAGTTTSFVVTPTAATAILTARILAANGSVAAGPFVASGAGAAVAIPSLSLVSGTYRLSVTSTVATGVNLTAARNAVIEDQVGDTTQTDELRIDSSYQNLGGGGAYGALGRSNGGLIMSKVSNSTSFIDISARGNRLNLSDDAEASIVTTVGNALFPAGDVTISNNGAILAARSFNLAFTNTDLSSLAQNTPVALYPFWDDIDGGAGSVFWIEENVSGVPTLIVQWDNRPHFNGVGSTTFQLQLYARGSVLARFVYEDVVFENSSYDFGQSATVGVVGPVSRKQFSFNQPSLANNDAIEIRSFGEIDEYEFRGTAGQSVDVAFDALGTANLSDSVVGLYRDNTLLATAVNNPVVSTATVGNYDLGIHSFVLPANAIYTVRLTSRSEFDYYLSVTKNVVLDTENLPLNVYPARIIDQVPGTMMGFLSVGDPRDVDAIRLNAGRTVRFTLTRTGDEAGYSPATNLVPRLSIIRVDDSIGSTASTFNDSGEMIIDYLVPESGRYRIAVDRIAGIGEYVVKASILQAAATVNLAAPMVVNTDAALLPKAVTNSVLDYMSDVNGDGEITPLDALLIINQLNQPAVRRAEASSSVSQVDEQTAAYDLYFDISGDGVVSPLDALLVINRLNKRR